MYHHWSSLEYHWSVGSSTEVTSLFVNQPMVVKLVKEICGATSSGSRDSASTESGWNLGITKELREWFMSISLQIMSKRTISAERPLDSRSYLSGPCETTEIKDALCFRLNVHLWKIKKLPYQQNPGSVLTIRKVRTIRTSLMTRTLLALCSWPPLRKILSAVKKSYITVSRLSTNIYIYIYITIYIYTPIYTHVCINYNQLYTFYVWSIYHHLVVFASVRLSIIIYLSVYREPKQYTPRNKIHNASTANIDTHKAFLLHPTDMHIFWQISYYGKSYTNEPKCHVIIWKDPLKVDVSHVDCTPLWGPGRRKNE